MEKLLVLSQSRNSLQFMQFKSSSPCSQYPTSFLSWNRSIQYTPSHSNLSHLFENHASLLLDLPRVLFPSYLPTKTLYAFPPPARSTCLVRHNFLDLLMSTNNYTLPSSLLLLYCSQAETSPWTPSAYIPVLMWQRYKTTGKIGVVQFLIFISLHSRGEIWVLYIVDVIRV